jgi:DNA helicase HerA-like ATPase
MSQGRKRGFAGIIATQRLSKLHKDAAAEANNVIIGRTWLDADQVRAGDALGLSKADRLKLRDVG